MKLESWLLNWKQKEKADITLSDLFGNLYMNIFFDNSCMNILIIYMYESLLQSVSFMPFIHFLKTFFAMINLFVWLIECLVDMCRGKLHFPS